MRYMSVAGNEAGVFLASEAFVCDAGRFSL